MDIVTNIDDVITDLERRLAIAGTRKVLAQQLQVHEVYITNVLLHRKPPATMLMKALGLYKSITFCRTDGLKTEPTPPMVALGRTVTRLKKAK